MGSMHEYFVIGKDFKMQKIIIIITSLIVAYIISLVINSISAYFKINLWWLEVPSIFGVYSFIKSLVDKYWWAKFYKIPSFDGIWKGNIKSSNDNFSTNIPVECVIKQNAKLICVEFEMEKSISYSTSATVDDTIINGTKLEYNYINIPKIDQNELLNVHLGNTTLKLNGNVLEGEYYNKQRDTKGIIHLEKKEEN